MNKPHHLLLNKPPYGRVFSVVRGLVFYAAGRTFE